MFFVVALALTGLILIFLEFFVPGVVMAVGGALLLLSSVYFFYKIAPDPIWLFTYFICLNLCAWLAVRLAIWRVKMTSQKGTIYLSRDQEGYQASDYPKELIGSVGIAATDLKPSGHIWIGDTSFQALSKTGYIDKGSSVEILGGEGAHLIVILRK